jgi:predicted ATPase/DNA-binding SARP family transcriptional activator
MEIRVLGPVEVRSENGTIREIALQQRRLLAALTTEAGQACSTDALVHALWGEEPPSSAAKVLQVYVSRLRRQLPPSARIDTRGGGYVLEVDAPSLDTVSFEQLLEEGREAMRADNPALALSLLRRALALWRGPAYGEFRDEEFARFEAGRLEELRVVALEERIEAELAAGRDRELLPELQALAAARPTRERLQAHLMLVLYRAGRQPEALDVYAYLRTTLRDELGLEPGAELRDLQRQILRQDPALNRKSTGVSPATVLPEPSNRLLGRGRELVELRDLVARGDVRLLVLTGAGGSGKTRLALEAARQAVPMFANGAAFVDLSPLRDPQLVVGAIARALGLQELVGDLFEAVAEVLRPREQLLLVDNAEHLLPAMPILVQLLARAPRLTLLVTSRVVLHLSGEHVYPVEPLAGEAPEALFWERARDADPRLESSPRDEENIRRICGRLDGLPLAIELAAGWVRTLSTGELLARLDPRLPLLVGGPTDLPARQQTIRATLHWSYDLLNEDERRLIARLGVFRGGCTLETAEIVCDAELDPLASLVDKSLLRRRTGRLGEGRYWMLETVREFALELLEESGEAENLRRRHAQRMLALARAAHLGAYDTLSDLESGLAEGEDLRAALDWAQGNDVKLGLEIAVELQNLWYASAPTEGMQRFERLLGSARGAIPPELRAQALRVYGGTTDLVGLNDQGEQLIKESLRLFRELGDERGIAATEHMLGVSAWRRHDWPRVRELASHSLELARDRFPLTEITNYWLLGQLAVSEGKVERATQLTRRSAEAAQAAGWAWWEAGQHHELLMLALRRGDLDEAEQEGFAALRMEREQENRLWTLYTLAGLAQVALARGDLERAGVLWGAAEEEARSLQRWPEERAHRGGPLLEESREPFVAASDLGRELELWDAAALALGEGSN